MGLRKALSPSQPVAPVAVKHDSVTLRRLLMAGGCAHHEQEHASVRLAEPIWPGHVTRLLSHRGQGSAVQGSPENLFGPFLIVRQAQIEEDRQALLKTKRLTGT